MKKNIQNNDCSEILARTALLYKPTKGGSKVMCIGMLRHNKVWAREYLKVTPNNVLIASIYRNNN